MLPDGIVAIVNRECATCALVEPVLRQIEGITVLVEDDGDRVMELSWRLGIHTVPTLLRVKDGEVVEETEGWVRAEWESLTGIDGLGADLPAFKPGCGSLTQDPVIAEQLAALYEADRLRSRRVEIGRDEDEADALFERGWTDGLPVVAPTAERVLRMLRGTTRDPQDVVAVVPPDLVECTVEKVAINAVLAGCRPEYLPVVLACVEAACTDEFNAHGLLATTYFSGPVVIVNGPVANAIGMNSGGNAFGQGNRANATIGRALQLVIRNVGGGKPGGVDRATFGNPGKYTFCFAEREHDSPWEPLHVERGFNADASTVTLFAGDGPRPFVDQLSRTPEALVATLTPALRSAILVSRDAILAISPEHARVFSQAAWTKARLREALAVRSEGFLIVHVGGSAGLFSAIIGSWVGGPMGSQPVTREVLS